MVATSNNISYSELKKTVTITMMTTTTYVLIIDTLKVLMHASGCSSSQSETADVSGMVYALVFPPEVSLGTL